VKTHVCATGTTTQVWQRVFLVIHLLAEECPSFSKACMALKIPLRSEKYGDSKIKEAAGNVLITFAERSSLGFVLSQGWTHLFCLVFETFFKKVDLSTNI
jgi:hypothetical protein